MAATFTVGATTITFGLMLADSGIKRKAAVTVEHIPGGNTTYVDRGGLEAPMLKGKALIETYADLLSLQNIAGNSGTLVYSEATYTATLMSADESRALGAGGRRFVDVEFVITG